MHWWTGLTLLLCWAVLTASGPAQADERQISYNRDVRPILSDNCFACHGPDAKQLKGGVECILGIHRDPVFGPIAMFGLGGIFVEVMKDVVFRRAPFGPDVAERMIRGIKGAPLLLGSLERFFR